MSQIEFYDQNSHENSTDDQNHATTSTIEENSKDIKLLGHKKNKYFICSFINCGKSYKEVKDFRSHIVTHVGYRPFLCPYEDCHKSFETEANLKVHESNHTTDKPFLCQTCGKAYSRICRLKIHERTHMGIKPFVCPHPGCEKSFNEKGNLNTHYRIHTGEKPYVCTYEGCGQSFKAQGHLKDHIKRHYNIRPYACDLCTARFARTSTLKIHMNTHTGEKNFKCSFEGCTKRFTEKGNMKTHYKTHFVVPKEKRNFDELSEKNENKFSTTESKDLSNTFCGPPFAFRKDYSKKIEKRKEKNEKNETQNNIASAQPFINTNPSIMSNGMLGYGLDAYIQTPWMTAYDPQIFHPFSHYWSNLMQQWSTAAQMQASYYNTVDCFGKLLNNVKGI